MDVVFMEISLEDGAIEMGAARRVPGALPIVRRKAAVGYIRL